MKIEHVRSNNSDNGRVTSKTIVESDESYGLAGGGVNSHGTTSDFPDHRSFNVEVYKKDPDNDSVTHRYVVRFTPEECEAIAPKMAEYAKTKGIP